METLDRLIAKAPTFAGLRPEHLQLIADCGGNVRFADGEYIFREGGAANRFYLIRSGAVALEIFVRGRAPVVIETLHEHEVLGWSWLFEPYRWQFDARAMGAVRATFFDGACLRGKCDADHELGYQLMRRFAATMEERLQATRLRLLDVYGGVHAG
jgi:CRP/FNR family transcriptional regulator, cyclic AMP receptor protein